MSKISEGTTVASQDGDLVPIYRSGQATGTEYVVDVGEELADKLALAGGTMTGTLTLAGAPSSDLDAATKAYTDTRAADYVPLAGGTMTGALTLSADPTADMQAATKQYVDSLPAGGGGVSRMVYNVLDYGAEGDGSTNDQAAIQSAIDAAGAATYGGTVYLPAGLYLVGDHNNATEFGTEDRHALRLMSNVEIRGESMHNTTIGIHPDANGVSFTIIYAPESPAVENTGVTNLRINGTHPTQPTYGGELANWKNGASKILCQNLYLENALDNGLDFDGCSDVLVDNCLVYDCAGGGIHCAGSGFNNATISNCYVEGCAKNRVLGTGGEEVAAAGIDIWAGSGVTVTGCVMVGNARQFASRDGTNLQVTGCVFRQTFAAGTAAYYEFEAVRLYALASAQNVTFAGCEFYNANANEHGVEIANGWTDATFTGCKFIGTNGIEIDDGENVYVTGCTFDVSTEAISDESTRTGSLTISASEIKSGGIVTTNGSGAINTCTFSKNNGGAQGLRCNEGAVGWQFVNNTVIGALKACRGMATSVSNELLVANNVMPDAEIEINSSDNEIRQNVFGILTSGGNTSDNTIRFNQITDSIVFSAALPQVLANQRWEGNYGAGFTDVQNPAATAVEAHNRGTATMTNGTVVVDNHLVGSLGSINPPRFRFTRITGATNVGFLMLGTIVPYESFEIKAVDETGATLSGDNGQVYWEMLSTQD